MILSSKGWADFLSNLVLPFVRIGRPWSLGDLYCFQTVDHCMTFYVNIIQGGNKTASNTVVLFMMARPKDHEFGTLDMIASTKDREGSVAITVLSIPLFKF